MISLKKIKLTNFISHGETEIEFRDGQRVEISGASGSGKSSIVDAITFALYNKCRGDGRSVVKKGTSKATATIYLFDDEKKKYWKIERSISGKGKHDLCIYSSDNGDKYKIAEFVGIKEKQEFIEKRLLKASYLLFVNSIAYLQEHSESFVNQSAQKKKELLLEIIGADDYDEYYDRAKTEIMKMETTIATSEVTIGASERELSSANDVVGKSLGSDEKLKELSLLIPKYKEEEENINRDILDLSSTIAMLKQQELANRRSEDIIAEKTAKIEKLTKDLEEINGIKIDEEMGKLSELEALRAELALLERGKEELATFNESRYKIMLERPVGRDFNAEIERYNKEIIDLLKKEIPKCHNCQTPYKDYQAEKELGVEKLKNEMELCIEAKKNFLKRAEENDKKLEILGPEPVFNQLRYAEIKYKIDDLSKIETRISDMKARQATASLINSTIAELRSEVERERASISEPVDISKTVAIRSQKEDRAREIKSLLYGATKEQFELESIIGAANEARKRIPVIEEKIMEEKTKIEKVKRDKESLLIIKDAFGQNGIRSMVIDILVPSLEEKINNILSRLSDFRIRIDTQADGAGEGVVKEGLFITIINEAGEELSFSNYSGGEKMKISFSIFEALAELSKINFRILDETFFALDENSIDGFVSVVNVLQKEVNNIICISHIQQIKDLFDDKILVVKNNGTSKIIK